MLLAPTKPRQINSLLIEAINKKSGKKDPIADSFCVATRSESCAGMKSSALAQINTRYHIFCSTIGHFNHNLSEMQGSVESSLLVSQSIIECFNAYVNFITQECSLFHTVAYPLYFHL